MIGELIIQAREKKHLTQKQLGNLLGGRSAQFVSNIERNKNGVPLKHIKFLSKLLELSKKDIVKKLVSDYREKIEICLKD